MPTTTIRIEDRLELRVAVAAERADKSTHAFIVDAIAATVEQAEVDAGFQRLAEGRWKGLVRSGESIEWSEARRYLQARARGERAVRPAPRKPGR